jgi:hypothetical protein
VPPQQLAVTTGLMNTLGSWVGGMPMCHGAGGLAAQHYYGTRTGGANVLEGLIEDRTTATRCDDRGSHLGHDEREKTSSGSCGCGQVG